MSMVTVSTKRDRVYQRAFDHDEAIRLHAEGAGVRELADRFGVSEAGMRRVLDPKTRERMDKAANEWARRAFKVVSTEGE